MSTTVKAMKPLKIKETFDNEPKSPDDTPPNFEPKSPDDTPPNFEPKSPDDAPPKEDIFKPKTRQPMSKKRTKSSVSLFTNITCVKNVILPLHSVGKNIVSKLKEELIASYEGICSTDGFVKPDSLGILTYSSGKLIDGHVELKVTCQMEVCDPAEGFVLSCIAKNITKAGIRAVTKDYEPSPLVVFIARDHHHMNKKFQNVSENDIIQVKIIGKRYELNDEYISVIGELIN